jgi:RNA polymerase sigma-70 factor (ECF subfamily)
LTASSDETLLARYREGDGAAFEILYARHRQSLYRFLLGLSGKPELADEVFQDTWLSLIRSTSQPQGRATFRTWLFQIARNRLIDHWRKHGAYQPLHDSYDEQLHAVGDETHDPEQLLNLSRDSQRLESACNPCPPTSAKCFCCVPTATSTWRKSPASPKHRWKPSRAACATPSKNCVGCWPRRY